jgi:hypothetical protein
MFPRFSAKFKIPGPLETRVQNLATLHTYPYGFLAVTNPSARNTRISIVSILQKNTQSGSICRSRLASQTFLDLYSSLIFFWDPEQNPECFRSRRIFFSKLAKTHPYLSFPLWHACSSVYSFFIQFRPARINLQT